MNTWKAITGIILLIIGIGVFWQNYNVVRACNTLVGKVSTFVTSIFGGNGQQSCYNASIAEVAGVLVAIIGLVVIYSASRSATKKGRK